MLALVPVVGYLSQAPCSPWDDFPVQLSGLCLVLLLISSSNCWLALNTPSHTHYSDCFTVASGCSWSLLYSSLMLSLLCGGAVRFSQSAPIDSPYWPLYWLPQEQWWEISNLLVMCCNWLTYSPHWQMFSCPVPNLYISSHVPELGEVLGLVLIAAA